MTKAAEVEPWFTVEKIDSDTFAVSEYKHWEETHCYLLRGTGCAVLIDTGLGVADIRDIVDGLTDLPVLAVTTHVHWDHIGGHGYFENIAVHECERGWLEVIHTPGHSPGHCCFYELERGYLFTGDLVYRGCLDAFYPTTDLQMFLQSLGKIKRLKAGKVLPGHHRLHIPAESIDEIERAFRMLNDEGKLVQGNGMFDFGEYQIHI